MEIHGYGQTEVDLITKIGTEPGGKNRDDGRYGKNPIIVLWQTAHIQLIQLASLQTIIHGSLIIVQLGSDTSVRKVVKVINIKDSSHQIIQHGEKR